MDTQVLIQELERLRDGQPDAEKRLLFAISRSSLVLLTENDPADDGDDGAVTVRLKVFTLNGQVTAVLFSSQEALEQWCGRYGIPAYALPVHGGDLGFLIPQNTWLQLDPETPHACSLSPDQLNLLTQVPAEVVGMAVPVMAEEEPEAADASAEVLAPPSDEDQGFFVPMKAADDRADRSAVMAQSQPDPALPVLSKAMTPAAGPAKRRFVPRTEPTTMFQAPVVDRKEPETGAKKRTTTSSNLKKIIRALPSTDES
jgi:hypothetical protein